MTTWNTPYGLCSAVAYPIPINQISNSVDLEIFVMNTGETEFAASWAEYRRIAKMLGMSACAAHSNKIGVVLSQAIITSIIYDPDLDGLALYDPVALPTNKEKPPVGLATPEKHQCTCSSRDLFINMGCICKPEGLKSVPWIFEKELEIK
jgi:hypothetical protein